MFFQLQLEVSVAAKWELVLSLQTCFTSPLSPVALFCSCKSRTIRSMLLYAQRYRTDAFRTGEPRTSSSSFTQLMGFDSNCCSKSSKLLYVRRDHKDYQGRGSPIQCCFMSTETTGLITDGEPRTATSTFTQLLSELWGNPVWPPRLLHSS